MSAPYGFLDYGEDDSDVNGGISSVILKAELTSADNLAAAFGVTVGTAPTFDATRGMIGSGAGCIKFVAGAGNPTWTVANANKLKYGGHVSMWVEKTMLDADTLISAISALFSLSATPGAPYPCLQFINNSTPQKGIVHSFGAAAGSIILSSSYGKDDLVPIVVSWTSCPGAANFSCYAELYIDGVLCWYSKGTVSANFDPTSISFFGLVNAAQPMPASQGALKRIQVSTRPIFLPIARDDLNFVAFGDSITAQGGLNVLTNGSAYNRCPHSFVTANTQNTEGGYTDVGFIVGIRRQFAKHNILPNIWCYGIFGHKATNFNARVNLAYDTDRASNPNRDTFFDCAVVMYGTNDAVAASPTTKANYKTQMETGLTNLINRGIRKIFLIKPPTTMHYTGTAQVLAVNGAATTDYGDACAELAVTYPEIVLLDGFTALGGHNDASMFQFLASSQQHPGPKGQKALSDLLNTAIEANVTW